jgi:hypothetical protein
VKFGDDTCSLILKFTEILFGLVDIINLTDILVEIRHTIHGMDRTLLEGARSERVEVDKFWGVTRFPKRFAAFLLAPDCKSQRRESQVRNEQEGLGATARTGQSALRSGIDAGRIAECSGGIVLWELLDGGMILSRLWIRIVLWIVRRSVLVSSLQCLFRENWSYIFPYNPVVQACPPSYLRTTL